MGQIEEKRWVPFGLSSEEYENPTDKKLLKGLKTLRPLNFVVEKFFSKWDVPRMEAYNLAMGIKVSCRQAKPIFKICEECAEILGVNLPEIYIIQDPYVNAETYGDGKENNYVSLYSGLIDAMTENELYAIIGHEMGHIKSGHALYHTIALWMGIGTMIGTDMLSQVVGPFVKIPAFVVRPAFLAWMRESEITADRAGLICSQDIDVTCKALAKTHFGSRKLADMVNIEEVLAQEKEIQEKGLAAKVEKWTKMEHPFLSRRVKDLMDFYRSDDYKHIFIGRRLVRGRYRLREDYYNTLKLGRDATTKMVESAYETLASEAKEKFRQEDTRSKYLRRIREACDILKNSKKRQRYNELLEGENLKTSFSQNNGPLGQN